MTIHERIARRAYQLFEARAAQDGQDLADWFQAEREIHDSYGFRYFSFALQYYIAGRFAVHAGLNPVAGNLLHHAIELALKGGLLRRTTSDDLKEEYGHSLDPLWREFKRTLSQPGLDHFDRVVSELNQFETIRYPDHIEQHGMFAGISPTRRPKGPKQRSKLPSPVPRYSLFVPEIDALLDAIFLGSSVNPAAYKGEAFRPEAKEFLARDNSTRLRDLSQ